MDFQGLDFVLEGVKNLKAKNEWIAHFLTIQRTV